MIKNIKIKNYKSIKDGNIDLGKINILIGGNGAGKSNFINFLKLLNNIVEQKLQNFIAENDGADNLLYYGQKESDFIMGEIIFDTDPNENKYGFILKPTENDKMFFSDETIGFRGEKYIKNDGDFYIDEIAEANFETNLFLDSKKSNFRRMSDHVKERLIEFKIFHFHDTSAAARVKKACNIEDNEFLKEDAGNLAAFLYKLQEKDAKALKRIEKTINMVAPYFEKFILKPSISNEESIRLSWKEKNSDKIFNASHLSDGTLRMICLTTLFLQPNLPKIIILDEPELGLHPYAISILSELIISATEKGTQVIISSQSVTLINLFSINDVIVVDRKDKESVFKRLNEEELEDWIEDYTLGELWEKNLLGGRP